MVDQPQSQQAQPAAEPAPAPPAAELCPRCGEPFEAEARFCEECGYQRDGTAEGPAIAAPADEPTAERSIVWWLIVLLWVLLAVGGLVWLFARAILL